MSSPKSESRAKPHGERRQVFILRPRRLLIGATIGGAITGKIALPRFETWEALLAGALLGVLVWSTVLFYRRWAPQLGPLTIWAAIACLWALVFGVVGASSADCENTSCYLAAAGGNAGGGAVTAFGLAILTLPWRTGRRLWRWRRNRRQARAARSRQPARNAGRQTDKAVGKTKPVGSKKKTGRGRP